MFYGYHETIKDGIDKAIKNVNANNCNSLQIFVSNPQSIKKNPIRNKEEIQKSLYLINRLKTKLFIHSPYVINIAKHFTLKDKQIQYMIKELNTGAALSSCGNVLHVGKYLTLDKEEAIQNMKHNIELILKHSNPKSRLLIETPAGQGTELFYRLEDLALFFNSLKQKNKRLGICVDTCHIFAAGYDIRTKEGVISYFKLFNKLIGLKHLKVIHLNDSYNRFGSRVDNHENLGKGFIGKTGLTYVINVAKKYKIPLILETPNKNDAEELEFVKHVLAKMS